MKNLKNSTKAITALDTGFVVVLFVLPVALGLMYVGKAVYTPAVAAHGTVAATPASGFLADVIVKMKSVTDQIQL